MIRIVDRYWEKLDNFLLSREKIEKLEDRGDSKQKFDEDFANGILNYYLGKWVVYHNGNLIGQFTHRDPLLEEARKLCEGVEAYIVL